jgi:hypothetical protein
MKNKNKKHIHLVNYICDFFIVHSLCYNFKKNIPYRYPDKCLKYSYPGNIGQN